DLASSIARTRSGSISTSPTAKTRRRCKRSSSTDGSRSDQSDLARVAARAGPSHFAVSEVPAADVQPRARIVAGVRRGDDRAAHRSGGAAGSHGLGRQADRRRGGGGNARREASIRPLSMALETASLLQQLLILASYAVLLARLSPWSVLLIVAASVPSFIAEARFSGESFRLNTWRAPEGRRQNYLEWILTRDSHVKEVKLFDLAPLVLRRYRALFKKFYAEDRSLAMRKGAAGLALGFVSLAAFYGAYA